MAKKSDKSGNAVYYNANKDGKAFDVIKTNADGTVDIGIGSVVAVKSCPVSDVAKEGHVTLGADAVETDADETQSAEKTAAAATQVAAERTEN